MCGYVCTFARISNDGGEPINAFTRTLEVAKIDYFSALGAVLLDDRRPADGRVIPDKTGARIRQIYTKKKPKK